MIFTLIVSDKPVTKRYQIEEAGKLRQYSGGQITSGTAYTLKAASLDELAERIGNAQGRNWALCSGVSGKPKARIVTKHALASTPGALTRTRAHFHFPAGSGLLVLDYDPPKGEPALSAEELRAALIECCPWLASVGMLIAASASSYIFGVSTGEMLVGPGGLHCYVAIDDARAIPNAVDAIFQQTFWRFGYAAISKSGAVFPRSLIDRSTPQPERLFFEAGAATGPGLEQRRPPPLVIPGAILASATIPDMPDFDEWKKCDEWTTMCREAKPEAERIREEWIAERLASGKVSAATLRRAVSEGTIADDFEIIVDGKPVSVAAVRADMAKFESVQIADPLEPDYHNGALVAVIFDWGIWSWAHGGYKLRFDKQLPFDEVRTQKEGLDIDQVSTRTKVEFDE